MSYDSLSALNSPSAMYNAVIHGLKDRMVETVEVKPYSSFNTDKVAGIQLYVEVPSFSSGTMRADGCYAQQMEFTVHCLVSLAIENAELRALDLASAVDRIVQRNRWGLSGAVDEPQHVSASEGLIGTGRNAFEGWVVTWHQTVYLGKPNVPDDESRGGIRFAINPEDDGNPSEYRPLESKP